MSDTHFYSAYARTDINELFKFELEEIEIKKVYENGTIELKHPYFYCKDDSSYFFGGRSGNELDKEIILRYGTVYYSTDKNKCKDFLLNKMREQNKLADKIRERMKESKLEIELLEGERWNLKSLKHGAINVLVMGVGEC